MRPDSLPSRSSSFGVRAFLYSAVSSSGSNCARSSSVRGDDVRDVEGIPRTSYRMISPIAHSRVSPTFLLGALAVLVAITFQILLPVVPVMVERAGPHGAAGAATAALFLGAVTGELTTPWLLKRWSSKRVLITAQIVTAVASLVYFIRHAAWWAMLGAAY